MEALDTDDDGTINKEEFIVAAIGKEVLFSETVLRAGFGLICNTARGGLKDATHFTIPQLQSFVKDYIRADNPVWTAVKELFDKNGDGLIDFEEMVHGLRLKE